VHGFAVRSSHPLKALRGPCGLYPQYNILHCIISGYALQLGALKWPFLARVATRCCPWYAGDRLQPKSLLGTSLLGKHGIGEARFLHPQEPLAISAALRSHLQARSRALVTHNSSCDLRAGGEKWPLTEWISINGNGNTAFASDSLALEQLATHCAPGLHTAGSCSHCGLQSRSATKYRLLGDAKSPSPGLEVSGWELNPV
jgi:hypothetical protein